MLTTQRPHRQTGANDMLFDLEPYIPMDAFIILWLCTMFAIVAWGESRDNRNDN